MNRSVTPPKCGRVIASPAEVLSNTLIKVPLAARFYNWLGPRLLHGAIWSLVGTVISRGLSLASSVFVARWLGKESFGEFGVLQTTVGMFAVFAGFGMGMTATKHVAELRQSNPERAGRLIGLSTWVAWVAGGAMTLVLLLAALPLASRTLAAPRLAPYLRFCAPLALLGSLNGAQLGALTGFEAFKRITQVNVLSAVISFPLVAVGAWKFELDGAVCGLVLGQAATWLITGTALRSEAAKAGVPISYQGMRTEARVLWRFSLPSVVTGVLVMPVNWACAAILVNQPGGYGQMGIFSVASQWRGFVMLVPNTLIGMSLPILANLVGLNDQAGHRRVSSTTILINVGVTALLALGVGLASPLILGFYGTDYQGGSMSIWLLVMSAIPAAYGYANSQVLASHGRMWASAAMLAVWAAILVALSILLVPQWQSEGLAFANLIAQVFYALIQVVYLRKLNHEKSL
jgi:O-antigen/teichoic acid export membrane protein